MKQTNNWEEEFDKEFENKYRHARNTDATEHCDDSCDIRHSHHYHALDQDKQREWIKSFLHQELTNLLKTVAEAIGEEEPIKTNLGEVRRQYFRNSTMQSDSISDAYDDGSNNRRSQIISNISEKYPEFKYLVDKPMSNIPQISKEAIDNAFKLAKEEMDKK